MYDILRSAHSGWRYIVLILLVLAVVKAVSGWLGNKTYTKGDKSLNLFTLISAHIQLLIGLVLYFMGSWYKMNATGDAAVRYFKMEHISMMILAIILITIGYSRSKKLIAGVAKHRAISIFFGLALMIIVVAILLMVKDVPGKSFFGMN